MRWYFSVGYSLEVTEEQAVLVGDGIYALEAETLAGAAEFLRNLEGAGQGYALLSAHRADLKNGLKKATVGLAGVMP